ncbi:MAG TPA: AraC family transcriptional regulator [Rhodospirillales bacterium]|nr:AraC family transcriptional regulator [Rhodospirillales bacterium]
MDALTDVLRAMRLSGAVFLEGEFTAPWSISSHVDPQDCRPFMPPPVQLIAYHYVLEGRLLLQVEGEPPVDAGAGRLLMLPRNEPHILASAPGLPPANADDLVEPAGEDGLARIRFGGGGPVTRILCGFLGSDNRADPLLASLPPVVNLDLTGNLTGTWIEGSVRYAARELAGGGPGASVNLARLAELLFAEAVRQYLKALPRARTGWLAGLCDPHVGRALALMHRRPGHPWTLDELAREVGLSRSALAERFGRFVGASPIRYLQRWRIELAAARLTDGRQPIAQIAYETGYESEAAFSRAFKRELGRSPGAFRRPAGAE